MSSYNYSSNNGRAEADIVTLVDDTGRSLDCFVENTLQQRDSHYFLLMPIDTPVTIIVWDDEHKNSEAILVEEETEISDIFADAQAVLAEFDLTLKRSAYTLTVAGEIAATEEEETLTIEIEELDGEIEVEEFRFLVSFRHDEQDYEIYTPITPLLLLAKKINAQGDLRLLNPDELPNIQPVIEELLFEEVDEFDEN